MADAPARQTELEIDLKAQVNLVRVTATEALSQHFTITIDLLAQLDEIDFVDHLGKPATVKVNDENGEEQRHFNGLLVDAEFVEERGLLGFHYRLTLRPAAYFHSQGRDFRIFQQMTTKDIITKVLERCGIKHNFKLAGPDGPPRAYCVQYGESDFAFVSRLMEEDGYYYFYLHTAGEHDLTICDAPSSHQVNDDASPLLFNEHSGSIGMADSATRFASGQKKFIRSWHERVCTGAEQKVTVRDFDFMKPKQQLESNATGKGAQDFEIEVYEYPARTWVPAVTKTRSEALLDERAANRRSYSAVTGHGGVRCGATFVFDHHPIDRFNGSYLVVGTYHEIATEVYASDFSFTGGTEVHVEAIPADVKWRAPLTTRRPVVRGPETAWVTGPADEEIYTDKYGRVKVQFHWDREGKLDDNSSCWIRVSQTGGLGNIILPRVGHEVLVDFIDGNPDRPLVVGRVFNETHMPAYPLPAEKTKATWRSKTYKEKDATKSGEGWVGIDNRGINEFRFDDKAAKEEVYLYAQKDMNTEVQNSETHFIGTDLETKVGKNRTMKVGNDDNITVVKNRSTEIGEKETRAIKGQRETKVDNTEDLDVGQSIKIKAGTEIMIEAGTKITLKVGGSTIVMDPMSIEIKTMTLKSNGSLLAEHKGGGANSIQMMPIPFSISGPLIKIN